MLKALAKDPNHRFTSAAELAVSELRLYLESRPTRSRPVGPFEHFWRWCKRSPGMAAASILAGLLTAASSSARRLQPGSSGNKIVGRVRICSILSPRSASPALQQAGGAAFREPRHPRPGRCARP